MNTAQAVRKVNAEVSAAAVNLAKYYSPSDYPSFAPYQPAYPQSRKTARITASTFRASSK